MRKFKVEVNSISNSNAKTQIKNSLNKIDGVDEVCVDRAEGTITVEYKSPATEKVIKDSIEHAGHTIEKDLH